LSEDFFLHFCYIWRFFEFPQRAFGTIHFKNSSNMAKKVASNPASITNNFRKQKNIHLKYNYFSFDHQGFFFHTVMKGGWFSKKLTTYTNKWMMMARIFNLFDISWKSKTLSNMLVIKSFNAKCFFMNICRKRTSIGMGGEKLICGRFSWAKKYANRLF
jgi:hypothetical protein